MTWINVVRMGQDHFYGMRFFPEKFALLSAPLLAAVIFLGLVVAGLAANFGHIHGQARDRAGLSWHETPLEYTDETTRVDCNQVQSQGQDESSHCNFGPNHVVLSPGLRSYRTAALTDMIFGAANAGLLTPTHLAPPLPPPKSALLI